MGSRSRRIVRAAVCCAVLTAPSGTALAQGPTLSAAGFRDSVGVGTHPIYFDTPYGQWDQVVARFRELGVAHMRSGVYSSPNRDWNARHWGDLSALARAGVRLHLIVNRDCSGTGSMEPCLDVVRSQLPAGAVDHLEWDDETDLSDGPNWASSLAAWGRELHARVKGDPALSAIPVVGPALPRYESPGVLGDQSAFLDRGSIHPYTGALSPNPGLIEAEKLRISPVSGAKPVYATEAGFHTALGAVNPSQPAADEQTAAVYTLRTLLEHFRSGLARTYLYELVDEGADPANADASFGLLRHDFSRKPAFTALRNLLAMAGSAAPATLTPLRYRVSGDTSGLRQLVLQQADRTYLLVLWRTASIWDRVAKRPLEVAPRAYDLEVPGAVSLARGLPMASAGFSAGSLSSGGRFTQNVGEHPVVLRLGIQPDGQSGFGVAGSSASSGRRHDAKPIIRRVRVKKIASRRWAVYFRLTERSTVGTRLDRGRKDSRTRYRLLRRIAVKRLRAGNRRRITLGDFQVGRHRVLLSARDATGTETNVLVSFKIRARKTRR